jgi:hypothetical protein
MSRKKKRYTIPKIRSLRFPEKRALACHKHLGPDEPNPGCDPELYVS